MSRRDRGSAPVEFIVLSVCVMVPMVYVVLAIMRVQSAAMGVTNAAREAGRAYALAATDSAGLTRARSAARLALRDQGIAATDASVTATCARRPCISPGATITVTVATRVSLPLLPDSLPARIPVTSTHVATVSRFGSGS